MVKRETARMLLCGGTSRRGAEEHAAVDLAEEHGLSEADHRACRGEWRGHTVVRVPSLSSLPA